MFDLNIFGKNLVVKDKNKNKITTSDKQTFIDLVDTFYMTHQRSLKVEKEHGLKLEKYDNLFYILIENLFFTHYGEWQGELILWYVYEHPLAESDEDRTLNDTDGNAYIIHTSEELYNLIVTLQDE